MLRCADSHAVLAENEIERSAPIVVYSSSATYWRAVITAGTRDMCRAQLPLSRLPERAAIADFWHGRRPFFIHFQKSRLSFSLATPLTAPLHATNLRVPAYIQLMK
jgi:hypothetical protein